MQQQNTFKYNSTSGQLKGTVSRRDLERYEELFKLHSVHLNEQAHVSPYGMGILHGMVRQAMINPENEITDELLVEFNQAYWDCIADMRDYVKFDDSLPAGG